MTMLMSFITGAGLKIVAGVISSFIKLKREEKLLLLDADVARMQALYGGEIKSNPFADWTRRFLAIMITSTLCGIVAWICLFNPEQSFNIAVDKNPSWLLSLFLGSIDKGILKLSAGALLWEFVNFVSMICGFYFTKILSTNTRVE